MKYIIEIFMVILICSLTSCDNCDCPNKYEEVKVFNGIVINKHKKLYNIYNPALHVFLPRAKCFVMSKDSVEYEVQSYEYNRLELGDSLFERRMIRVHLDSCRYKEK